jgi:hypothetical protein
MRLRLVLKTVVVFFAWRCWCFAHVFCAPTALEVVGEMIAAKRTGVACLQVEAQAGMIGKASSELQQLAEERQTLRARAVQLSAQEEEVRARATAAAQKEAELAAESAR